MEEITEEVLASGIILPQSVPQIQKESVKMVLKTFVLS